MFATAHHSKRRRMGHPAAIAVLLFLITVAGPALIGSAMSSVRGQGSPDVPVPDGGPAVPEGLKISCKYLLTAYCLMC